MFERGVRVLIFENVQVGVRVIFSCDVNDSVDILVKT